MKTVYPLFAAAALAVSGCECGDSGPKSPDDFEDVSLVVVHAREGVETVRRVRVPRHVAKSVIAKWKSEYITDPRDGMTDVISVTDEFAFREDAIFVYAEPLADAPADMEKVGE